MSTEQARERRHPWGWIVPRHFPVSMERTKRTPPPKAKANSHGLPALAVELVRLAFIGGRTGAAGREETIEEEVE